MARWVQVEGWPMYEISDEGVLRRVFKNGKFRYQKGRPAGPFSAGTRYLYFALRNKGPMWQPRAHRLVAKHFLPPPPEDMANPTINHIDENKHNNNYWNLEWVTNTENQRYSSNLDMEKVRIIRHLVDAGIERKVVAQAFDINYSSLCQIIQERRWA